MKYELNNSTIATKQALQTNVSKSNFSRQNKKEWFYHFDQSKVSNFAINNAPKLQITNYKYSW